MVVYKHVYTVYIYAIYTAASHCFPIAQTGKQFVHTVNRLCTLYVSGPLCYTTIHYFIYVYINKIEVYACHATGMNIILVKRVCARE